MLHVAFPQAGNKNKFVQIDLLLTKYPDFTRFLKMNESDLHFQNEIYYKFATYCLPITTSNPINYESI